MTGKKQKLELTWIGKKNRPKLEARILLDDPEKSYHAAHRERDKDIFDNHLSFIDNLVTMKHFWTSLRGDDRGDEVRA